MTGRMAMITISAASAGSGPVYSRGWEVPADVDAMDQFAATLTEAYGEPAEWVSDETGSPGIVIYEGDR